MKSLECQICFHEFDECRRRPRILSCGHTFCSICLKSLLKDGKIACPNCKKYHVAENIENININFILEKFLSPDDASNAAVLDIGYKCKDHFYEQNFFCQTHEEWICRDCTVIKHKPCSHSENCDNENDCKVFTKTEKLDKIKSDKRDKLIRISESYGKVLKWHINQYDSKINSKIRLREDLQKRLKKFAEENDSEINVLREKLDSSRNILLNVQKHRELVNLAYDEMTNAQGRIAVEESCKNIDKIISSAVEWAEKEKCNVKEDKKCIADVEINLQEFESLKQKLCEVESLLFESKNEIKDLKCKIAEQESTNGHLKSKLEDNLVLQEKLETKEKCLLLGSKNEIKDLKCKIAEQESTNGHLKSKLEDYKEDNLVLQEKLETKEKSSVDKGDTLCARDERITELIKELNNSNREGDNYREEIEFIKKTIANKLDKCLDKICQKYRNSWIDRNQMPVVETRNVCELKNHLLGRTRDAYLFKKLFNEKGDYENYYGHLTVYRNDYEDIVMVEAFQKYFSPGSLLLECPSIIPNLGSAEYVFLDIGKMEKLHNPRLLGSPFGTLVIELTTSPRRKDQMLDLCSSIDSHQLKNCNFSVIRNKDRPGELVTCKHYQKILDDNEQMTCTERREVLYRDLENIDEEHPIVAGNVFGYLDDGAGFSIITRDNHSRDTKWPLLGKVVSGLHFLQDAVRHHNVETIGIHSHGIGFPTGNINPKVESLSYFEKLIGLY